MARHHAVVDTLIRQPRRIYSKKQTRRKYVFAFAVFVSLFAGVLTILLVRGIEYHRAREEYTAVQMSFEGSVIATEDGANFFASAPMPTEYFVTNASVETNSPLVPTHSQSEAIATPAPFYSAEVAQLKKENRDTVGWLDISGTKIQYPIVQGKDNKYYLNHTFKKKTNASGAIFLDCWNMADFTDFNTVIYGHNMKDGSMFNGLREYRYQKFFNEHRYIEITLLNKKLRYRVFAAYVSQGEASTDFRGQNCATEEQRSVFIKAARKRSTELASNETVSRHDRLLTLVTCTGGDHPWFWVVHAVLDKEV